MTWWQILIAVAAGSALYWSVIGPVLRAAWRGRWWIIGMPVLWLRRTKCRAGMHDEGERISAMHPYDHCLRCGERIGS